MNYSGMFHNLELWKESIVSPIICKKIPSDLFLIPYNLMTNIDISCGYGNETV